MTFLCEEVYERVREILPILQRNYIFEPVGEVLRKVIEYNIRRYLDVASPLPCEVSVILAPDGHGSHSIEIRIDIRDIFQLERPYYRINYVF